MRGMKKMGKWINIDDLPAGRVEWEDIFDAPSIDIVRCKECKYSSDDGTYGCMADHFNGLDDVYHRMYADDFCSYGERSE